MSLNIDELDKKSLLNVMMVTRQLHATTDLQESLSLVIDVTLETLNADRATVFLYDQGKHELYSKVATGTDEIRFSAELGIAGECATKRDVVNVSDCYSDHRFNQAVDKATGYRTRCLLTLPLIGHDESLVGVLQVLNKAGGVFTYADELLGQTLATQCATALQRARFIDEMMQKEKMERDLVVAKEIQSALIPERLPAVDGYDIAGFAEPADETGGDLYDVIQCHNNELLIMLGDATGHGVGPALSISQVRAMLRVALRMNADLDQLYTVINDQLAEDLPNSRFVTALIGLLDSDNHVLSYHAPGHGPMVLIRADGSHELFKATTFPLGLFGDNPVPEQMKLHLNPGDVFAVMSDGYFDVVGADGEHLGEASVVACLREHRDKTSRQIIQILHHQAVEFNGDTPQDDDMTIVLIKRV